MLLHVSACTGLIPVHYSNTPLHFYNALCYIVALNTFSIFESKYFLAFTQVEKLMWYSYFYKLLSMYLYLDLN